jgi:hypothetical protein
MNEEMACPNCGSTDLQIEGVWSVYPNDIYPDGDNRIHLRTDDISCYCMTCEREWAPTAEQESRYRAMMDKIERSPR